MSTDGRLLGALLLNVGITVAQVVGGILAGSLSLLADAVHNASDAASLVVSWSARRISRRRADRRRTFGYSRAEVIGALINLVALVVIALYLMGHAVWRLLNPTEVAGTIMVVVGSIAFVEDMASAALLYRDSRHSLNIKSAFLHMLGDTLATVAVIVGGLAIMFFDFHMIDPILTLLISVYILIHCSGALRDTIRILMQSVPVGLDLHEVVSAMESVDGVESVHHVHIWMLDEHATALEAHVVVSSLSLEEIDAVRRRTKERLRNLFAIGHTTLEIEHNECADLDESVIPTE